MRVKALSERAGVAPHIVRYYTRLGLLHPVREGRNRYRSYADDDVYRLRFIRSARWLGFTLKDVKTILVDADNGVSPCPEVRELIVQRAQENHSRLKILEELQQRMEVAVTTWSELPDRKPTHEHLCYLIDLMAEGGGRLT